jgi:hypothetical protein
MAGLLLHAPTGEIALTAATAKTCLTLKAPANHRVKLLGLEIFFKGTSATDTPVKIEISRITTDGGTATTLTPAPNDENAGETPLGTYKSAYTVEPSTYGVNVKTWEVHPQTGLIVYFPLGQEVIIKGGNILGLRLTSSQTETVSIDPVFEE